MKNLSIQAKIYIPLVALSGLAIAIMMFFFFDSIQNIENGVLQEKESKFKTLVSKKLNAKTQTGLLSAINLAQNRFIVEALLQNDKSIAKQELINLANISKEFSDYKNIKIHIHTPNIKSFLRHWNNKSGDDLSSFRDTIIKVKETKKPLAGIEVGRAGLALRGLAPIFNDKEYIGSVEFIQSFESIVSDLKKSTNIDVVISINKSLLNIAESLKEAPKVISGSYVVAQNIKNANEELIKELDNVSEKEIQKSFSTKSYFVSKLELHDFKGENIGYIFIADTNSHVFDDIRKAESGMITQMVVVVIAVGLVIFTLMIVMRLYIVRPINELKQHANDLDMGDGDLTKEIPIKSNDEIGKTAYEFNQVYQKSKKYSSYGKRRK